MPTTFTGIQNENEFYSHHYLSEVFANDIQTTTARWRESAAESEGGQRAPDQALRALATPYLRFRQQFSRERRHETRVSLQREWFRQILTALGYDFQPANHLLDDDTGDGRAHPPRRRRSSKARRSFSSSVPMTRTETTKTHYHFGPTARSTTARSHHRNRS